MCPRLFLFSLPQLCRFEKVAELLQVCWFDVRGKTNTRVLSPKTHYSAYMVFKKADQCYGFKDEAIEAVV